MQQYLEIGKVNNTHGLKGEVKFDFWCDDISYLKQLKTLYTDSEGKGALTLSCVRPQKNIAILKFAEITTIEQAEELKGRVLFCNRDDAQIDEDAYYIADIIGCAVVDSETGEEYGKINDVMNYGSCDIYEVKKDKKTYLVPATPDIIIEIDFENEKVMIKPMKGLFDEN
ncbi:MAG: 16S rRNA processing protein RimM [Eubacterium sp.]|nr:16S rRNA processing protein RimM [Eubacterium sp.]